MSDLQELTNELMQDVAFRREYEALQPERPHVVFDSCEKGSRTYADGVIRENRNLHLVKHISELFKAQKHGNDQTFSFLQMSPRAPMSKT